MAGAKQIFLDAARQDKAIHIGVHVELFMLNHLYGSKAVLRSMAQAQAVGAAVSSKLTTLWTTRNSGLLAPQGPKDRFVMHRAFSAIANPKHSDFIEKNDIQVSLITGMTASKCVDATKRDCEQRGMTPIMVLDAIDLCAPGNDREWLQELAEDQWGQSLHTAMTSDIEQWVREI